MNRSFAGVAAVAWRESRTARRRLLLYMSSIVFGVAALVAIDSFADNATRTVQEQARALLGGDLALLSRDTFPAPTLQLFDSLSRAGFGVARQTTFATMAVAGDTTAMRLVQVRGVTEGFPWYGGVETEPADSWTALQDRPIAVVDSSLLVTLNASLGDTLSLGAERFVIRGTIRSVTGEAAVTATVGPRVYVADRFLSRTALIGFGSTAEFEAVVKLPDDFSAARFQGRFGTRLSKSRVRIRTVAQNQAGLTISIDQLRNFVSLVGLIALLLGGIGVASGVHAFVLRKIDTVAVLRCLGATSWQVLIIYVLQAAALGLVGAIVGAVLGVGAQFALPRLLQNYLPPGVVVAFAPRAAFLGLAIGVWVALVFSLRPLLALRSISPLQALRRDADAVVLRKVRRDSSAAVVTFAAVASIFMMTLSRADRWQAGVGFGVAIFAAIGAIWLVSAVLISAARRSVRPGWPFVLRQAVASLHRPGNQTRAVVLSLGFGVFLMSTLYQAKTNILSQLNARITQLHANVAFFDIQGDQAAGVDSIVRASRDELEQRIPIVTVRIAAINGRPADSLIAEANAAGEAGGSGTGSSSAGRGRGTTPGASAAFDGGRGGRGRVFSRDWRATYGETLDSFETIAAGRWFGASRDGSAEVSLDSALAPRLNVTIGDVVTWNVQGISVATTVTSFRAVDHNRIQPTFPVIFSPHAMDGAPQQFVFLVQAPDARAVALLQRGVLRRYPNVSSLDLTLVEQTIHDVLAKVTTAIQFMAIISLCLAVPVLFSAVAATRRERLREGVLFKTLGATRRQVGRMMVAEYIILGGLGSLAGVLLSVGSAWALLHFLFKVPYTPAVLPAMAVSAGMTLVSVAIGVLTGREVFATTPMAALREA
jgi:putative ABC transport system permease protein